MNITMLLTAIFFIVACSRSTTPQKSETPSVTVPFLIDHKRITVEIVFKRADGSPRRARAWVDSGGTKVILSEQLARELGVGLSGMPQDSEHSFDTTTPVPVLSLGNVPLDTEGMTFSVHPGRFARPGVHAECTLPARCFRKLHVVFDYPAQKLTLAMPGRLNPKGTAVPCRVNPDTGLFMVETTIDDEKVALGVDTGAAGTWVSKELTSAWLRRHPDWKSAVGSAGSTNFFGFPFETQGTLLSIPTIEIGPIPTRRETALLGLDQSMFDWYSEKSAAPVAGFLGADLLADFRLEVDFQGQMTWWQPGPPSANRDLDIVGLILRADADGTFTIGGAVQRNDRPVVSGVMPGDKLISVDKLDARNASMGAVIDSLRGKPGEQRALRLQRDGREIAIQATVMHLP